MTAHMPILQVILPLLAAPLCVILGRGTLAWLLSLAVSWGSFAVVDLSSCLRPSTARS